MKTIKISMAMAFILFLSSCGSGLSGTYKSDKRGIELDFISSSKVQAKSGGYVVEYDYEKDGDQVKLSEGGVTQIIKVDDEGCLTLMNTKFCKAD